MVFKPDQYTDMLAVVRIFDKLFRIATRKDAFGESPFKDIAGYGLLGALNDEEEMMDQNQYYSLSKKLRREGKSSEEFEILFNNLSLEEVIGLKFELSSKFGLNGKIYGTPIWSSCTRIIKDALLKYALSAAKSKREAARFLGIQESNFTYLTKNIKQKIILKIYFLKRNSL